MKPQRALEIAIAKIGGQAPLARLLGITQPTVFHWLKKGQHMPAEHVLKTEAASGVSRHDLRPDIYPREDEAA